MKDWIEAAYRKWRWPGAYVFFLILLFMVMAPPAHPPQTEAADLTAKEILDRVDDLWRGNSSHGKMAMTITTENWTRTLEIEVWSQGKDKSLLRILAPKKEQGTTTLRSGNNIWNFLPKVKRVIKLPSSMMASSWMGSHFTNDDLVKESRMAEDYNFEFTFQGQREGREVIEVTCWPREEAVVVWGKVVVTVARADSMPVDVVYYDEDLKKARTMVFEDPGPLGDRTLPRRLVIQPADKPKESTLIVYESMEFNLDLPEDLFSIRRLQQ